MKFIVKPQPVKGKDKENRGGGWDITMCALCSEDPRFCGADS